MNANPTYLNVDVSEFPSQNPFFFLIFMVTIHSTTIFLKLNNFFFYIEWAAYPPQKKKGMGYAFFYNYRKTYRFNLLLYFIDRNK